MSAIVALAVSRLADYCYGQLALTVTVAVTVAVTFAVAVRVRECGEHVLYKLSGFGTVLAVGVTVAVAVTLQCYSYCYTYSWSYGSLPRTHCLYNPNQIAHRHCCRLWLSTDPQASGDLGGGHIGHTGRAGHTGCAGRAGVQGSGWD